MQRVRTLTHSWAIVFALTSTASTADNTPPEGFVALFNGKDLTGWKGLLAPPLDNPANRAKASPDDLVKAQKEADDDMRAHWKALDGVIVFDGKGRSLCTAKDYGDFELFVDWKIEPLGDSGLYLRGTPQVQIWDPFTDPSKNNIGSGGLFNNEQKPYFGAWRDLASAKPGYPLGSVTKDGPADKAGIKGGDIVIQFGENKIGNRDDFESALRKYKAGDKVPLVIMRGDVEVKLEVVLGPANPSLPNKVADKPIGQWNTFKIKMVGERVTVHLNGEPVVDNVVLENYWERDKPVYSTGQIELQNHGNSLYFKNIYVRELPR